MILIITCLGLIGIVAYYCYCRSLQFGTVEIFLLCLALNFGGTTLLSLWLTKIEVSALVAAWVHVLIYLSVLPFVLWVNHIRPTIGRVFCLTNIISISRTVSTPVIALILAGNIGLLFYAYKTYGLFFAIVLHGSDQLAEQVLPYWFTSVFGYSRVIIFALIAPLTMHCLYYRGRKCFYSGALLSLALTISAASGRRNLVYALLLIFALNIAYQKKNLFSVTSILRYGVGMIIVLLFSNFYSSVRNNLDKNLSFTQDLNGKSILELFLNFDKTSENADRLTGWTFSNLVYSIRNDMLVPPPFGQLLIAELARTVPRLLNPDKSNVDIKDLVADQLGIEHSDHTTTIFSISFLDMGYFSLLFIPLFLSMLYTFWALLFTMAKTNLIKVTIFGSAFLTLMYIETDYLSIFCTTRDMVLLLLIERGFLQFFQGFGKGRVQTRSEIECGTS